MKREEAAWQQLVAKARQAKDDRETAAPFGFATRVAALAMAGEMRPARSLLDLFSWRALGLAGLLAVASLVANYSLLNSGVGDDDVLSDEGAVATLFGSS